MRKRLRRRAADEVDGEIQRETFQGTLPAWTTVDEMVAGLGEEMPALRKAMQRVRAARDLLASLESPVSFDWYGHRRQVNPDRRYMPYPQRCRVCKKRGQHLQGQNATVQSYWCEFCDKPFTVPYPPTRPTRGITR